MIFLRPNAESERHVISLTCARVGKLWRGGVLCRENDMMSTFMVALCYFALSLTNMITWDAVMYE